MRAQSFKIKGEVLFDDKQVPLKGTAIKIKGHLLGVITDKDGALSINAPQ